MASATLRERFLGVPVSRTPGKVSFATTSRVEFASRSPIPWRHRR
jgi:hypothetical protein